MKKLLILSSVAIFLGLFTQSCKKVKDGCTAPTACNYDASANNDDRSCMFAKTWYRDKDGDGKGTPNESEVSCTQPEGFVDNRIDDNDLNVLARQRAVMIYRGATWCPPCGAYGDPTKEYVHGAYGDDCIILSSQSNDDITSSGEFGYTFGGEYMTFVGATGIPHGFWLGENFAMADRGFYTDANANNSAAAADIDAIMGNTPTVGVTAEARIEGGNIIIDTKAEFYAAAGQRYISVFVTENNVLADQAHSVNGTVPGMAHNHIIRATATTSASASLGLESMGTSFATGEEFVNSYSIPLGSGWSSGNLEAVVMIWSSTQPDGILNAFVIPVSQ